MINELCSGLVVSGYTMHMILHAATIIMMAWYKNSIHITGPFFRGIHWWPVDSPHKWPVIWNFDVSLFVSLNQLLNKQSNGQWLRWHNIHVTSLKWKQNVSKTLNSLLTGHSLSVIVFWKQLTVLLWDCTCKAFVIDCYSRTIYQMSFRH